MTAENKELVDDCFYVTQKRWGTWDSYDKEDRAIITSLTKEECINATRAYLKMKQEGFADSKTYDGNVAGKL
jgi:hypothetical protein